MRLSASVSGTSLLTIHWASPSTIAVLPTPGSPMSTGLFLVLLERISMMVSTSSARPMTGSSFPSFAIRVRSRLYSSTIGVATGPGPVGAPGGIHLVLIQSFADVLVRPEDQYTSSSISYYVGTTALCREPPLTMSERAGKCSLSHRRWSRTPATASPGSSATPRTVPRNAGHYRYVVGPCSSWAILISRPTRYSASSRVVPICTSFSIRGP